jgi:aryl-alcohol dehydrogenase-like predicted oxidoreductase
MCNDVWMTSTPGTLISREPRRLGKFEVGPLAYGLWRFTSANVAVGQRLLEAALDAGMNLIDTADVYGFDWGGTGFGSVEENLGRVLAQARGLRERMVLSTKGGIRPPIPYDSSRDGLRSACEDSLRRLGVEVIDLYQIHRPDMLTHPSEVASTLMALRDEGKIREIGVSNHTPAQVAALQAHLDCPIASTQPEYSAACTRPLRDGTFEQCMERGILPLVWSPLAGGALVTGEGVRPELLATLDRLADRNDCDRGTVALGFALAHPARPVVIIGTQNLDRISQARAALDCPLDRQDIYDIIQASEGVPLP